MRLYVTENGSIDLELTSAGLASESTIQSAILISILTDRRANLDDRLPIEENSGQNIPPDRRGWAGDALSTINGDKYGSRLWLLVREKQTNETLNRAVEYVHEALAWLKSDGHATKIEVTAAWQGQGRLEVQVIVYLAKGSSFSTKISVTSGGVYAI